MQPFFMPWKSILSIAPGWVGDLCLPASGAGLLTVCGYL